MSKLDELGRVIREAEDELLLDPSRRADVRSRLLSRPMRSARARAPRAVAFSLAAMAAAAVVLFVAWPDAPLTYTIGADARPGTRGAITVATVPMTLRFSDGSAIRLAPASRARITELDARGAHVNLEDGSASLEVTHRDKTDWTVHAGPFLVHVVGTAFDVAWDDDGAVFELSVREGSVWAEGPRLTRRLVRTGERVRVALAPAPRAEAPASPGVVEPATVTPPVIAPRAEAMAVRDRIVPTEHTVPDAAPMAEQAPDFSELAARGRPDEAWASAEATGIDALVARLGPEELLRLGDLARRVGDPSAARIYRVLRERHPGTSAAASAAFLLARLDVARGDLAHAEEGFETYLAEQRTGRYRREALGRLVEVRLARGRSGEAEASARRYLELFPEGPHAELARRVVGAP